ncbi:hypothetical protein A2333_00650 [Candidatus Wolfebacteria bacterium RIFOXYB2_FULL_49_7]|uniref:Uncharacterized protein n=2 Tax=Parcubacteria group TaxID=1794811 RepID=A0A1F8DZF4_9BACT|nr:MAG: hypothetical protein A2372_01805 [Candidatus Wolfebacteria bacterium RIFOXYB1_FULL_54_12]OGM94062.1 MAG: hypothetical protein A2333_00650 [Candidatus Wolfebacteria bacterium RIFOXYB2_FULL_49_7]OGZ89810.1 MAG: hypothetical protein A2561_03895 [Candidatus Staskawiczbacteria bacterium RIFOXYD1_FULL_32_13]
MLVVATCSGGIVAMSRATVNLWSWYMAPFTAELEEVYKKKGSMLLTPAQSLLGPGFTFEELRVARLFLNDRLSS